MVGLHIRVYRKLDDKRSSDILLDGWKGKPMLNRDAAIDCFSNKWLLVEGFDEN